MDRYKSPDEHPFFPQCLPEPVLPPIQYPQVKLKDHTQDCNGAMPLMHMTHVKFLFSLVPGSTSLCRFDKHQQEGVENVFQTTSSQTGQARGRW